MREAETVYVTGATGFVGSHLVERLIRENYRVRALVLDGEDVSHLRSMGVETVRGDVRDLPDKLRDGLADVTHVFHCAAWVDDGAPRQRMVEVNVNGLQNLLEAVRPEVLQRFVLLSSVTVYGDRDQINLKESSPFHKTGDSYNFTKVECERGFWKFVRKTGMPGVALRATYVYGPRDGRFFPKLCSVLKSRTWVYLDGGRVPITLVHVLDLVDACMLAATRDEAIGQAFIIAHDEPITRRELVELVCREMGYPPPRSSIPRGFGKVLCPLTDGLSVAFGWKKQRFVNRFLCHFAGTHLTFDISKARRLLGFSPKRALRESLRETTSWLRENRPDLLRPDRHLPH